MFAFIGLAGLYNFIVLTVWTVGMFVLVTYHLHTNIIPYVLWAYAMATTPWASIASDEAKLDPRTKAMTWVAGCQFGAIAVIVPVFVGSGLQTPFGMMVFFVPAAIAGIAITALLQRAPRFA